MDDLVLTNVADFCSLEDAQKIFDNHHPYIQNRSVKIITRAIRNFSGMVRETRNLYESPNNRDEEFGHTIWTRVYFCLYPKAYSQMWHRSSQAGWKKTVMLKYIHPQDFQRDYTRLELFHLQKRMQLIDMMMIGW